MRRIEALVSIGLLAAGCQANSSSLEQAPPLPPPAATADTEVPVFVTAICGDCHAVTEGTISPNPQAPGFADIANSPGLTRETLVTFLSDAHNYPMQMDVDLVEEDIEVIADYMMTLQSDDYHRTPS
ncbi:hypothetical protein K3163_10155 [Qipengyuania sp. 1NDW9]|uniref:hypothetical protein n=1 Tax=Qipengyuania xiapuensis TaxID=2867236 RepID=UPI001C87DCE8|nr:hypothetical protein [Qipengyuania xiapuensis]MBX7493570.1 hypothetical protein [Qipengyuania xiapuensis]